MYVKDHVPLASELHQLYILCKYTVGPRQDPTLSQPNSFPTPDPDLACACDMLVVNDHLKDSVSSSYLVIGIKN
jgi:hypothetical protein